MSPDAACHDLLVRLAGRLPDRLLWRLREWLATGAHTAVAATLPRALLRHRVGLTDAERDLLETALTLAVDDRPAARRALQAALAAAEPLDALRPFTHAEPGIHALLALQHGSFGAADPFAQRALAAGGTLVSDEAAPRFWVLCDPEGNEVCICTWQGRDEDDATDG